MASALVYETAIDSPFHRMDARWKLAAVGLTTIAVVLAQTAAGASLALLGSLGLLALSRLPASWFLRRLASVGLFLILFVILLPLTVPGDGLTLGRVTLSYEGFRLALLICCKALAVVALGLFLFATSPLDATFKAAHALHIPGLWVQLLMLTYRYAVLLGDELHKLRIALRQRAYRNRPALHSYRTLGRVTGTLLVRSFERAERVGHAMRCRGFHGQFRSIHSFRTRPADLAKFAGILLFVGLLPWLGGWIVAGS